MKPDRSGFTLLELIVVIFLMTLVIGLSAVFFANSVPSGKLAAAAREIASSIRQARHLAQLNGEKQVITINIDSRSYSLEGRGEKKLPSGVGLKVIDLLTGDVTTGKYHMTFYPAGSAEGGTVVLWNNSRATEIIVDPVAGAVVIK